MNEGMLFHITDQYGHTMCDPIMIPWDELYVLRQTFVCDVQYGQVIIY